MTKPITEPTRTNSNTSYVAINLGAKIDEGLSYIIQIHRMLLLILNGLILNQVKVYYSNTSYVAINLLLLLVLLLFVAIQIHRMLLLI